MVGDVHGWAGSEVWRGLMTRTGTVRVLIVDGDPLLRRALVTSVEAAGCVAEEAQTLREARAALASRKLNAMILEAVLPDGSGLDLLEDLRNEMVRLHVLMTTAALNPAVMNRAHFLRASCVIKPNISANVRVFLQRSIGAAGETAQRMMCAARDVSITNGLTAREHEIVELVALGVPRERLAEELGITENTLKTLIRRTLAKCRERSVEGVARAVLDEVVFLACAGEPV